MTKIVNLFENRQYVNLLFLFIYLLFSYPQDSEVNLPIIVLYLFLCTAISALYYNFTKKYWHAHQLVYYFFNISALFLSIS